jgi:D-glycero-alpha-D-manno-heptose-7-phosphate kinase
MICISRSPLRVSFFGGGTDYPEYFQLYPGAVLGASIDKYIYTTVLPMVGFAEHKYRITYRKVETVNTVDEIEHPSIRAVLKEYRYDGPLNIATLSDIPGNSGLGSSSSFTVGFIKLIEHLMGRNSSRLALMREAVRIEREVLGDNVGIQDQIHAAFGGLNHYHFHKGEFSAHPIAISPEGRRALDDSLFLVYSGVQRSASKVVAQQIENTREKKIIKELKELVDLCDDGAMVLQQQDPDVMLREFGRLISAGWETKRGFSPHVSTPRIDEIYDAAMAAGAYGGKLCGAGGGGFLLFSAPINAQEKIKSLVGSDNFVKIQTEDEGARIVAR